jgi:hypothetical protein
MLEVLNRAIIANLAARVAVQFQFADPKARFELGTEKGVFSVVLLIDISLRNLGIYVASRCRSMPQLYAKAGGQRRSQTAKPHRFPDGAFMLSGNERGHPVCRGVRL